MSVLRPRRNTSCATREAGITLLEYVRTCPSCLSRPPRPALSGLSPSLYFISSSPSSLSAFPLSSACILSGVSAVWLENEVTVGRPASRDVFQRWESSPNSPTHISARTCLAEDPAQAPVFAFDLDRICAGCVSPEARAARRVRRGRAHVAACRHEQREAVPDVQGEPGRCEVRWNVRLERGEAGGMVEQG